MLESRQKAQATLHYATYIQQHIAGCKIADSKLNLTRYTNS